MNWVGSFILNLELECLIAVFYRQKTWGGHLVGFVCINILLTSLSIFPWLCLMTDNNYSQLCGISNLNEKKNYLFFGKKRYRQSTEQTSTMPTPCSIKCVHTHTVYDAKGVLLCKRVNWFTVTRGFESLFNIYVAKSTDARETVLALPFNRINVLGVSIGVPNLISTPNTLVSQL